MVARAPSSVFASVLAALLACIACTACAAGCNTGPAEPTPAPAKEVKPAPTNARPAPAPSPDGVVKLGAPIEASAQKVSLAELSKSPTTYVGKTIATTGTVTEVCKHMGCWMEIKDDASEAHIKMAGHSFFVPRKATGRKATVLATVSKADQTEAECSNEDHAKGKKGCRAEAEEQMGRPLAKLELVAQGVELN